MKKIQITSVAQQFDSFFEDAAKSSVIELRLKIKQLETEYDELYDELRNVLDEKELEVTEYDPIPSDKEQELYSDIANLEHEVSLSKEKLLALMEMQVISLYKSYEIAQKELLSTAYKDVNKKYMYSWDNVKAFFNSKGFNFGRIQGYGYINQLRVVNNNIKHSLEIDDSVKRLRLNCFNDAIYFTADSLENFYKRVNKEVPAFLNTLSALIIKDLYEYDDQRLESIAKSYKEKMDKDTLANFSKLISKEVNALPNGIKW
ncbi:hypothetical protein [Vibrio splendidus]|uniref:hypothetical protein n=2 Tax=Vibrio splendidus TaxID=29497 RepID=UPI0039A55B4B